MLRDSVVVVRTRPRAIPLAMIAIRKILHGFPFLSRDAYGAPLGGPLGRRSSAIILVLLHQSVIWAHGLTCIWIWMYILPKHAAVHFIIFKILDILGSTYPEVAPKH